MIFFLSLCTQWLQHSAVKAKAAFCKTLQLCIKCTLSFQDNSLVIGSSVRCSCVAIKMSQRKYIPAKVQK